MTGAVLGSTIAVHGTVGMSLIGSRIDSEPGPLEWQRTILVVGDRPELAVALRDHLDRAYVTVYEVRPTEALDAMRVCRPWPWMVIGDTGDVDDPLREALASRPSLLLWRCAPPSGLPAHLRMLRRFSELAAAVDDALSAEVSGIRLAMGSGLTMPDRAHASSPVLEALVANHPRPVPASSRQLRAAAAALSAHSVPLQLRCRSNGAVLVPVEAADARQR